MANTERSGLTGRTWAGLWAAILTGATACGGVQIYITRGGPAESGVAVDADHDTVVALVELAKSHEKQIAGNCDAISALAATTRENQAVLTEQLDRLSVRIDRLLEQRAKP